jgi:hypothetical protein
MIEGQRFDYHPPGPFEQWVRRPLPERLRASQKGGAADEQIVRREGAGINSYSSSSVAGAGKARS